MWSVVLRSAVGTLCVASIVGTAQATDDIEVLKQRIERLEAQVELLTKRACVDPTLAVPSDARPPTASRAVPAPEARVPAGPVAIAAGPGEALAAYYLSADELGYRAPETDALTRGLFAPTARLELRPERYGVVEQGMFSGYEDPSRYRSAGLRLTGKLDLPYAGTYQFILAPKPAREGGGSPVVSAMSVRLEIGGDAVIDERDLRSWRHVELSRTLPGGRQSFTLWLVSNSPGYGAAPVNSTLTIDVRLPGRSEATPLSRFMRPPAP